MVDPRRRDKVEEGRKKSEGGKCQVVNIFSGSVLKEEGGGNKKRLLCNPFDKGELFPKGFFSSFFCSRSPVYVCARILILFFEVYPCSSFRKWVIFISIGNRLRLDVTFVCATYVHIFLVPKEEGMGKGELWCTRIIVSRCICRSKADC